jgi:four helix bundle protein
MRDDKENIIVELTFKFSLHIIQYCEQLESNKKYIISKQLLKSGTSIGANAREAQNAESKADFIHKFKVAAKEADETQYWLLLCNESENYPLSDSLIEELSVIIRTISKIISSSNFQIGTSSNFKL